MDYCVLSVPVSWSDEDEQRLCESGNGQPVDLDDPRLTEEVLECGDPIFNAYGNRFRVTFDMNEVLAIALE